MVSDVSGTDGQISFSLRSMTGFASIDGTHEGWRFSGDIRSVNGRGLDLRLRVPDWIDGLEPAIRKVLQSKLARGSVTLNLRVSRDETQPEIGLNAGQLEATLAILSEIEFAAQNKGLSLASLTAADVATMRGVIETREADTEQTPELRDAILAAVSASLTSFDDDRAREGAALAKVMDDQLEQILDMTERSSQAVGSRADAQRATLERGLSRLLEATEVPDEARLLQELAMIAVKTDVTEEIDRLKAHVDAARVLLDQEGAVGRKLDFLMQEFNREANTLCSKAQSNELTTIGLELKAVIDQMREQVQNIE